MAKSLGQILKILETCRSKMEIFATFKTKIAKLGIKFLKDFKFAKS